MTRLIATVLTVIFLCPVYMDADIQKPEDTGTVVREDPGGKPPEAEKIPLPNTGNGKRQSAPPRVYLTDLVATEDSPLKRYEVEYWEGTEKNEIWLVSREKPESRFFLSEFGYTARVLFSPNEKWIALDDIVDVCCRQDVLLFRRGGDGRYTNVKAAAIAAKSLVPIRRMLPTLKGVKLDRLYVHAVEWSDNERALLVRVNGEVTDGGHILHPCFCVYDVERLTASLDLAMFNKNNHEVFSLTGK